MKGKIEELKEIRAEVEKLQVNSDDFIKDLMQLLERTSRHLGEIDDQQEISWTAKSFDTAMQIKNGKINENDDEQKDLALTYLKEALDSVIIREQRYLK